MMPPDWRPPTLTTARLTLRPFTDDDARPLFEHARNPNVTRFTLWDHHQTVGETLAFVRDYARLRYREGMAEPYAITVRPGTEPVGACGCFWAAEPHQTMELGYWVAEPFWGRGYAAEASAAVLRYAFKSYQPERMQARVIAGNFASVRVLEKLNFRYEGTLRASLLRRSRFEDVMMFSLLRAEWAVGELTRGA
ncbi:gcn5 family n-acetyltransferase : Acetyltransferase (GNAT) domain protein OS=Bacteriovorax sp. BAL6_X GN=M902_0378 PE=4 SV=1: Acetyltransf_3 [Gemmataceae bacterium]|nr:gcn5 family n-acetyltransferase : Acetyltransferase (GNAT) domain protein OS=Bacteriovorax sp. BAL6_X GN=M902_0378 PE=4 SV=1: Acetyltransf_3 [Gemmataceae bacterium]VTU01597.1 gcn5 family n-acetyltransferase : Acetyltransferase (GNAT) domain protein OS=Bacteriovorax sp. BAL6_X GN=M902_0378 PE=4 SV=1: Acetyltransf_3 [Gemmataceae bacterium]